MANQYQHSLFIFHRDLRLEDNRALQEALAHSKQLTAVFIVDPVFNQDGERSFAKAFLAARLNELDGQLKALGAGLGIVFAAHTKALDKLLSSQQFDAVYWNREYTPFGLKRDEGIEGLCFQYKLPAFSFDDALLFPPGMVLKVDGLPYTVFTPFFNRAKRIPVEVPYRYQLTQQFDFPSSVHALESFDLAKLKSYWYLQDNAEDIYAPQQMLDSIFSSMKCFENYQEDRDIPALEGTTGLSVHLHFGTVSVRQAYKNIADSLGEGAPLLRQLYWRDFFTHIAFFFPHVFTSAFRKQYNNIPWSNDERWFQLWCQGQTGFPIVDAGMRQLNETGYMHNRVRMVVASFLVKDLHIDWRWGERYFKEKLIDYDSAVNNGNWQWAASTGCDAQPYFRIFNPWRQQERFDKNCAYIHRWLPELRSLSPKEIHQLHKPGLNFSEYPAPIVEHAIQAEYAKQLFKQHSQSADE